MEMTMNANFSQLSFDEMMLIDGGAWSWKEFGKSVLGSTVGGAAGGAVVGAMAGGVGAGPGALTGAVGGAITGAVTYLVCGWW